MHVMHVYSGEPANDRLAAVNNVTWDEGEELISCSESKEIIVCVKSDCDMGDDKLR